MASPKVQRRAYGSLVWCFLLALVSLAPHIIEPLETTPVYASLTVALVVVNLLALRWFDRAPCVAFQSYWYAALFIIGAMVFVDAGRHVPGAPFPFIAGLPSLATLAIRWFVSWRAARVYGVGALALIIPTGFAYREIAAFVLVVFVFLAVTVERKHTTRGAGFRKAQRMLEAGDQRVNNAIRRNQRRE